MGLESAIRRTMADSRSRETRAARIAGHITEGHLGQLSFEAMRAQFSRIEGSNVVNLRGHIPEVELVPVPIDQGPQAA